LFKPYQFYNTFKYYLVGVYERLQEDDIFLWSSAIAFKVLVAFIPILMLATGLLGIIFSTFFDGNSEDPYQAVVQFIQSFIPQYRRELLIKDVEQMARQGSTFTILGGIGLLLLAISFFTTIQSVISIVFRRLHQPRAWYMRYLFDLRMMLQVGLLFIVSVFLTILIATLQNIGIETLSNYPDAPQWSYSLWKALTSGTMGTVVPFLVTGLMFFPLYYFIPNPHPHWKSALVGTLFTTGLWESAKNIFTWYAATWNPYDRFTGFGSSIGELSLVVFVLIFWVYYSGSVFILGGILAALHEEKRSVK
jgi:membrane protein